MIFIDGSIPRSVADDLKKVREDVVFKHELFRPDTDDAEWLRYVGIEGWLVLTHDKHIRTRYGERQAIIDHGVGCFILTYKQDLKKEEITKIVLANLREMEAKFRTTKRPFIYTVSKTGVFRRYE